MQAGDVIGGQFDSLLAKLIVFGSSRQEALERSRRALDELTVEGMATALPFHRAVVRDPAFAPADVRRRRSPSTTSGSRTSSTTRSRAFTGGADADDRARPPASASSSRSAGSGSRSCCPRVSGPPRRAPRPAGGGKKRKRSPSGAGSTAAGGDALTSPMQGTIVKVEVSDGDTVSSGDLIVVLEAMKMEQPINAHKGGTVSGLTGDGRRHRRAPAPCCARSRTDRPRPWLPLRARSDRPLRKPPLGGRLHYLIGGTLPTEYRLWVEHDLTGPGWRNRQAFRLVVQTLPFALVFLLLPGPDRRPRLDRRLPARWSASAWATAPAPPSATGGWCSTACRSRPPRGGRGRAFGPIRPGSDGLKVPARVDDRERDQRVLAARVTRSRRSSWARREGAPPCRERSRRAHPAKLAWSRQAKVDRIQTVDQPHQDLAAINALHRSGACR